MDFANLISNANSLAELRPLVRTLGFGRQWTELAQEHWPDSLRTAAPAIVDRFISAGQRANLHAHVLQLPHLDTESAGRVARRIRAANPARLGFFVFVDAGFSTIALGASVVAEDLRLLIIERQHVRVTDVDALRELAARSGERGLELAMRHARVLDRSRVTQRFFQDFKAQRTLIAQGWRNLPHNAEDDRRQLALLFLCRLMFLYFLQRRGHLAGATDYLYDMWQSWTARRHTRSFYDARIKPLFFGVLNRRPERRSAAARRLGVLPYLNGGLFDRHALEQRHRSIDLPDRCVRQVFDNLLQRYRFTTQDAAESAAARATDAGIDPEMLGRVFEELMAEGQRADTGTYFTPPAVVDRLVLRGLHALTGARGCNANALRDLRVLDPACGSGAFLLGALNRVAEARAFLEGRTPESLKRELVERALYGVDLQDDAALLCALRLWLSLLPPDRAGQQNATAVQPLPNLDRNIRQGDALVDPIDLTRASLAARDVSWSIASNPQIRASLRALEPAAARYVNAEPDERGTLQKDLRHHEAELAGAWLAALNQTLLHSERELRADAAETDLFGERTRKALQATRDLDALRERKRKLDEVQQTLTDKKALPFFSFDIHFAQSHHAGFDLIVSNPPWVRAHRWPETLGKSIRDRYEVCRNAGWNPRAVDPRSAIRDPRVPAAQVDLSLLFLERALHLLAPGGALALLLPAKTWRSLYAGGARALVLRETRITHIEDHSLDQRSIFRADAFAGVLVASKVTPAGTTTIQVSCHQRKAPPLKFELQQNAISLFPGDPASPFLLVPPDVAAALRVMICAGPPIGAHADLPVSRGVFTGANDVLLVDEVRTKMGDHAWIRAEGYSRTPAGKRRASYRALIEESVLRPIVSGRELRAWSYQSERALIWAHDAAGRAQPLPTRTTRYLQRHAQRLQKRTSWRVGEPLGRVFSVASHTTQPKMAWRDLAPTLEAVALPACITRWGRTRELIPLNTVYYISPPSDRHARLLCAYFNSTPLRTFARAIAERAKDAHFRFFAWTIQQVPLPRAWQHGTLADALHDLARVISEQNTIGTSQQEQLDELVCQAYSLNSNHRAAIMTYDHWLGAAHL